MITLSTAATDTIKRSFTYYARYSSFLGADLLAVDIPVDAGGETSDRTLGVAEKVDFTVPLTDQGYSWSPTSDRHPLAANGQRIRVELGIGLGEAIEWFQRGEYLVIESKANGDAVQVTCAGLMYYIEEARLVTPYQPSGSIATAIRGLVEPAVSVVFDPNLVNRNVPSGMNFDEDRLGALNALCDAWPADYLMNSEGYLYVYNTATPRTPVATISSDTTGTLITAAGGSTRDGAYNVVVARGTATNGANLYAAEYDTTGGAKSYGGPFNPLPVPYFFESPLLTTVSEARASAQTILARLQRQTSREFEVEMVTDPRLQVGDRVLLQCPDYTGQAEIEKLQLDFGHDNPMRLTLRTVVS